MTGRNVIAVLGILLALLLLPVGSAVADPIRATTTPIEHFVVLMQSNHSFDNYFGVYRQADGVDLGTCMPLSTKNLSPEGCVKPFRLGKESPADLQDGPGIQRDQYNGGKMDGFLAAHRERGLDGTGTMGYYDDADLPYYWNVADNFTLFDRFFSSAATGSHLNHFYWVAGVPTPEGKERVPPAGYGDIPTIFDRLQERGVSWKFYVENYDPKITLRMPSIGPRAGQTTKVPLLNFARFIDNPTLFGKIVDLNEYYTDLRNGTLPAVSYVVPAGSSENPPSRVQAGQELVRTMTSELANSDYWSSSAFLWTYDGWGGFYDHVPPPKIDQFGYGFRVPALLISPYSRRGYVDHTVLDSTAVLKFIEQNWNLAPLGDRDSRSPGLASAFDFASPPRPPELLSTERSAAVAKHSAAVVYTAYGTAVLLASACGFGATPAGRRLRRWRPGGESES